MNLILVQVFVSHESKTPKYLNYESMTRKEITQYNIDDIIVASAVKSTNTNSSEGRYKILTKEELQDKTGMPYIRLIVEKVL